MIEKTRHSIESIVPYAIFETIRDSRGQHDLNYYKLRSLSSIANTRFSVPIGNITNSDFITIWTNIVTITGILIVIYFAIFCRAKRGSKMRQRQVKVD